MPEFITDFTEAMAREIVRKALKKVADFNGAIDGFVFTRFQDYHKQVFIDSIKSEICALKLSPRRHLDIKLSMASFAAWPTILDCIKWLAANISVTTENVQVWLEQKQLEGS